MQKIKKIIEKGREVEIWTRKATSSTEEAPKRKYVRSKKKKKLKKKKIFLTHKNLNVKIWY